MTRLISVCPSCASGQISRRCRKATGNEKYRCSDSFVAGIIGTQNKENVNIESVAATIEKGDPGHVFANNLTQRMTKPRTYGTIDISSGRHDSFVACIIRTNSCS